jgi:capsular polysaccharide biosynthesis protein
VASDGRIVVETVANPRKAERRIGVAIAKSLIGTGPSHTRAVLSGNGEPDAHFDTAALMLPPWNNYYHWTIECLPRIRLLEMYADDYGEYPDLLVPSDRPSWMEETIERINYDGRVVSWDGDIAHIDRLVVPSFPDPTSEECRWLRNRMRSSSKFGDEERIFISRTDASVRQIENLDEITPILKKYGFEKYILGNMNVNEQIDLFANSEVVIGPHGAGLSNIIYSDNLSVVELFGEKEVGSYSRLASLLNHEYTPISCRERRVNLIVDPELLEETLGNVISDSI